MYYDSEMPIPLDTHWVARRLKIGIDVLESVLNDFFVKTDDGWTNVKCQEVIDAYQRQKTGGKKGAEKRWGNREAMPTISDTNNEPNPPPIATINHKPITNNQEPLTNKKKTNTPLTPQGDDPLFDEFWQKYPRKESKGAAQRAWLKVKRPSDTLELIIEALKWQKVSDQWTKENGQYIPLPSTYLNQEKWLDEPIKDINFKPYESAHDKKNREWVEQMTGKAVQREPDIFDMTLAESRRLK
jgi:uncharacterized protein YdaU (DUF1376 family)